MAQDTAFKNSAALVTGGASGIGAATARAFATAGAAVAILDVQSGKGEELASSIRGDGGRALFIRCDLRDAVQVKTAIDRAASEFGGLHFAFNNGGIEGVPAPTPQVGLEDWDRLMDINLRGVWLCMKHEIPYMIAAGGGAIVNCASVAGLVGIANMAPYVASKHGVVGLTRTAAVEFAAQKVRVNAVCPGVIDTPMVQRFVGNDADARAALLANQPLARMGRPDEIASAVLWLCHPDAAFTTGHALAVDGGWTAR